MRDFEAIGVEIQGWRDEIVMAWARGLDHDQYMQNVGRWRQLNELEQRLQELKKRRDDERNDNDGATRRRGIAADTWDDDKLGVSSPF